METFVSEPLLWACLHSIFGSSLLLTRTIRSLKLLGNNSRVIETSCHRENAAVGGTILLTWRNTA